MDESPLDISPIVRESIELIRPRVDAARVSIAFEPAGPLPKLRGDERAMKQILLNLLSNAAKFTPANGHVSVTTRNLADGRFEIAVIDTGIGIDEDELEAVLLPFGQASSSYSVPPEGTGLGLSITKSLVEMQDGELDIESRRNNGTAVRIKFPKERQIP